MESEIKQAIREGNRRVGEITPQFDKSRSYINRLLNEMLDDGTLIREKEGREWVYYIAEEKAREASQNQWTDSRPEAQPEQADATTSTPAGEQSQVSPPTPAVSPSPSPNPNPMGAAMNMPVNREYDFSTEIPENVPPYIPAGDELAQILASIQTRHETGKLPRYLIGGPTGCGKTHLAQYVAQYLDAPLFGIQGKWSLNEADLLGSPVMVGDTSWWVDGELTKAIMASKEQPVVLLIDEVNRARPDSKGVLYSALDDRCEVRLDMRGGEKVSGDAQNLIVFGTVNEGSGYYNEQMDLAEIRRLSTKHNVDYLGKEHPDREANLIVERTPISEGLATLMVETANLVRIMADKPNNIDIGIPTANLISWAQEAYSYNERNMPNPVFEAAKATVLRPYYDSDPSAYSTVEQTISGKFDGAPFDEDDFESWKGMDIHAYVQQVREEREQEEQSA